MAGSFRRHFLSALTVAASLLIIEFLVVWADWAISLAIPFGILSGSILLWSGFRGALLAAAVTLIFPFYHFELYGYNGLLQILIGAGIISLNGILKRTIREEAQEIERERLRANENQSKADFVDGLNGNIEYLREINQDLIRLSLAVELMPKVSIISSINLIQDKTANLAQRAIGWQQLALAKKVVKGEEENGD